MNSLTKIVNIIDEKKLQSMIPWHTRYNKNGKTQSANSYNTLLTNNVRKILTIISGGSIVKMLDGKQFFQ